MNAPASGYRGIATGLALGVTGVGVAGWQAAHNEGAGPWVERASVVAIGATALAGGVMTATTLGTKLLTAAGKANANGHTRLAFGGSAVAGALLGAGVGGLLTLGSYGVSGLFSRVLP